MAKTPRIRIFHTRPHTLTALVQGEIATQTPIIPQREMSTEPGRQRVLECRERVGSRVDRELHSECFPAERRALPN